MFLFKMTINLNSFDQTSVIIEKFVTTALKLHNGSGNIRIDVKNVCIIT